MDVSRTQKGYPSPAGDGPGEPRGVPRAGVAKPSTVIPDGSHREPLLLVARPLELPQLPSFPRPQVGWGAAISLGTGLSTGNDDPGDRTIPFPSGHS